MNKRFDIRVGNFTILMLILRFLLRFYICMLLNLIIFQDQYKNEKRVNKIQHLQYLIYLLLPVLEQINREQSIELELEAKLKGTDDGLLQNNQTMTVLVNFCTLCLRSSIPPQVSVCLLMCSNSLQGAQYLKFRFSRMNLVAISYAAGMFIRVNSLSH